MHIGRSYKFWEFIFWTRRNIFWHIVVGTIPTLLYQVFASKWLFIPWSVVALLGSATAFIIGSGNVQTYNRTWEARQIWGAVIGGSWSWAVMCRDYIKDANKAKEIIYRHLAWLTALRYQLRRERKWETVNKPYNQEYKQFYRIPEKETPIEKELVKYITKEECEEIMARSNMAIQLLGIQSASLKQLYSHALIDDFQFLILQNTLRELSEHQGRSERIKNFPYPRQHAAISTLIVRLFCLLLPFALLQEFNQLAHDISGVMKGTILWFVIPLSVSISWVFTSLVQVGESTANPFEGSANDIPISQLSRAVEIDIREMLGETNLPPVLSPQNNIIL